MSTSTAKPKPSPITSGHERRRLNAEIVLAIRDINAIVLGTAERSGGAGLAACATLMVDYLALCHDYYSGGGKGDNLYETLERFEVIVGRAVEINTTQARSQ
jgi:hypothetical protein